MRSSAVSYNAAPALVGQGFGPASRASARLFRAEARNAARKGCPTVVPGS
jgi:hypothetical protein